MYDLQFLMKKYAGYHFQLWACKKTGITNFDNADRIEGDEFDFMNKYLDALKYVVFDNKEYSKFNNVQNVESDGFALQSFADEYKQTRENTVYVLLPHDWNYPYFVYKSYVEIPHNEKEGISAEQVINAVRELDINDYYENIEECSEIYGPFETEKEANEILYKLFDGLKTDWVVETGSNEGKVRAEIAWVEKDTWDGTGGIEAESFSMLAKPYDGKTG